MAGDEYYLYLCNDKKKILEEKYLGKLRYYPNKFSLIHFKFKGHNGFYEIEERMSDGNEIYTILKSEDITQIQNVLLDTPLSEGEKEAYEDTEDAVIWINNSSKKYTDNSLIYSSNLEPDSFHFIFYTDVD